MTTKKRTEQAADERVDQADELAREQVEAPDEDPRDATIRELRAQLDAIKATPEGAQNEMTRALAALSAEVERMKAGTGLVPVPVIAEPDPFLYWARLATGEIIEVQHPHATHHHSDRLGVVVPIETVFLKEPATA